jgi:hypothetical protein
MAIENSKHALVNFLSIEMFIENVWYISLEGQV